MNLYAIKDLITNKFSEIYTDINDGSFIRKLQNSLKDKNTSLYLNAKDLEVYRIAEYNNENGQISQKFEKITRIDLLITSFEK